MWKRETLVYRGDDITTVLVFRTMTRKTGALFGGLVGAGLGTLYASQTTNAQDAVTLIASTTAGGAMLGWVAPQDEAFVAFTRDESEAAKSRRYPPTGNLAQPVAADFAGAGLVPGDSLRIAMADGTENKGSLLSIDQRDLVLDTGHGQITRVPEDDVGGIWRRTHQPPSLRKGAVVGALIGATTAGLILASQAVSDLPSEDPDYFSAQDAATFIAFSAGVGMLTTRFMGHHEQAVMVRPSGKRADGAAKGWAVGWSMSFAR